MVNRDLHKSIYKENNIMTEYEEKFVSQGKKIKQAHSEEDKWII